LIGVVVLGSTGSIGVSTLEVLALHPERFQVVALAARSDVAGMFRQCVRFRPKIVAMVDASAAQDLARRLLPEAPEIQVVGGAQGVVEVARLGEADYVMAAIVGAAGLVPTLAAVRAGKRVLLANKEALVVSGRLFVEAAKASGADILPIDSEHNAVFQCLPNRFDGQYEQAGVTRILLTASGGPFRTWSREALAGVTPVQACAHPNWEMGRKISVDSATMMNKGLEVIEARWLFAAQAEQIQVVVHPQSVIHSLVEYSDGSILAQLGNPDMRTPIAHALAWPDRMASGVERLDLFAIAHLDFFAPDLQRFPCLRLAYDAIRAGGVAPAVLNAANEVAVDAFLKERLRFTDIPVVIEEVCQALNLGDAYSLEDLLAVDAEARSLAEQTLQRRVTL
jgi:1-deoxy-D-xylulose-5-phosphate reductoisomerase